MSKINNIIASFEKYMVVRKEYYRKYGTKECDGLAKPIKAKFIKELEDNYIVFRVVPLHINGELSPELSPNKNYLQFDKNRVSLGYGKILTIDSAYYIAV